MDIKMKFVMSIFCLVGLLDLIKSEICPLFRCAALPSGVCTNKTTNNTVIPQQYDLQSCPKNDQQCPFYNLDLNNTLNCETVGPYLVKQYPSGPCDTNTDCLSNNCTGNICQGVANGETCTKHRDCNYGYACMLNSSDVNATVKLCLPQKKEKESCTQDFDCINTHGCYNQTCTKYFSLPDGHPVEYTPARYLSFCQSGFEYSGACVRLSLANKDTECNDDTLHCNYTNYNNESLIIPQNCLCGYNPSGKKYCKMGNGQSEFVQYVSRVNGIIQDFSKCNTEERGLCNYNKRFPSKTFTDLNQKLYNAKVESEMHHQLIGADKCVIDVAFPQYTPDKPNPPEPTPNTTLSTCAKFSCVSRADKCAHSHFEKTLVNGSYYNNIAVNLSDICKSNEYCFIGGSPNTVFYNGSDIDGSCKTYTKTYSVLRYPGESCENDIDCWSPAEGKDTILGTCSPKGVCRGYNATQNCTETAACWKGNYCNEQGQCAAQKKENQNCTKTTECKNNLLCYQGKCQSVWYSLNVGTKVSGDGDYDAAYYCKFGKASNGVCDSMNSTDTADKKTGLVSCTLGQKCNYTTNSGAMTLDCQCGYNSDGNSYCPKGNNQDTSSWLNLGSAKARKTNNDCHSESRALCYNEDGGYFSKVKSYEQQTETAHLFYGSPSCVSKVLDESYVKISIILLLALVGLILA